MNDSNVKNYFGHYFDILPVFLSREPSFVELGFIVYRQIQYARNKSRFAFLTIPSRFAKSLSPSLSFSFSFSFSNLSDIAIGIPFLTLSEYRCTEARCSRFVIEQPRWGSWLSWRGSRAGRREVQSSCRLVLLPLSLIQYPSFSHSILWQFSSPFSLFFFNFIFFSLNARNRLIYQI